MKLTQELKTKKKDFISKMKQSLLDRYFELEFEKRIQERWALIDPTKTIYLNGVQVKIADYISSLKKDLNNLETRLELVEDVLKED